MRFKLTQLTIAAVQTESESFVLHSNRERARTRRAAVSWVWAKTGNCYIWTESEQELLNANLLHSIKRENGPGRGRGKFSESLPFFPLSTITHVQRFLYKTLLTSTPQSFNVGSRRIFLALWSRHISVRAIFKESHRRLQHSKFWTHSSSSSIFVTHNNRKEFLVQTGRSGRFSCPWCLWFTIQQQHEVAFICTEFQHIAYTSSLMLMKYVRYFAWFCNPAYSS